jgi:hypothetical protein
MDDDEPLRPAPNWLGWLISILAVAGIGFVIAGRVLDLGRYPGWQDALYSVLLAFSIDGTFLSPQNPLTPIGALLAALALYLTLFAGLLVLLRKRITAFRARHRRQHIIVAGDGEDAARLARRLSRSVPVTLASPDAPGNDRRFLGVGLPQGVDDLARVSGFTRARALVLMLSDEKQNAALAIALEAKRPPGAGPAIWCRLSERVMVDRVADASPGANRIRVFDDAQMVARDLVARHPMHAIADRLGASRVHLVVCGWTRLGEAIAQEAIFSGIARGLGTPTVTVLDKNAGAAEARYRAARAGLDLAADFAFIEADLPDVATAPGLATEALACLAARDEASSVTAIALCLDSEADNVRLALVLPELRRREGRYFAPVFIATSDAQGLRLAMGNGQDSGPGVVAMPRATGLIASDIVDAAKRDRAARNLHEAYLKLSGRSASASTDWNRLPETYRRANQRGADHIAAKLWSLGLTSERDPYQPIMVEAGAYDSVIAPLLAARASPALDALAELERRRWVAERAIDGWISGERRDDDLKVHPLLAARDYAQFSEADRQKDREQVVTLLASVIASTQAGVARIEHRVGLAGHRNLKPDDERQAVAGLAGQLAGLFGPADCVTLVTPLAPGADIAAAEGVAAALNSAGRELRLLVVEAVPYRIVLETAAAEHATDEGQRAAFVEAMLKRRKALLARFARVDLARIGQPGSDDSYRRDAANFERGLRRANAYLARRTDVLGLVWDGAPAGGPGGTGELALWRREPLRVLVDVDFPARSSSGEGRLVAIPVRRG